ncbi:MAG: hypothetical protein GY855_17095 [candidate division Zixibacteria bacterium]|nr:hypothetical protein [candidate division Zixibacteria bacterium]
MSEDTLLLVLGIIFIIFHEYIARAVLRLRLKLKLAKTIRPIDKKIAKYAYLITGIAFILVFIYRKL